ncbi:Murein DD-endopeptidase MepM and murein hydrolase activator NlpD, contain LysM domain [Thermoleophilum album]|uniref:Murein DD-endopeptidase MepM and murein hydrolase activator NlpD, contain LysM domain n=2 Tax=Thermoleophilum album TaxID=29539 RepID=A0A1H6FZH4_THEAL|nr:Murein DD-endopeptidase MepM and murein hydrolase activator NlpD, contain LysM domain [Thermoleophilum album]
MLGRGAVVMIGVATLVPAAAASPTGGAGIPDDPRVRALSCVATAQRPCPADGALVRGGKVKVEGSELQASTALIFRGRRGRRDDVRVKPRKVEEGGIEANVPRRARSGPVVVVNRFGATTRAARHVAVKAAARPEPIDAAPGGKFFFAGRSKPTFTFQVGRAVTAQVELVRESDGAVVRAWDVPAEPGRPAEIRWDGKTVDGGVQNGRYRFRIAGDAATAASPAPDAQADFAYFDHVFPIRGRHNMGYTDTNNFGGGRNHKGQDMFAACGTRLAAARGGRVKFAGYHSAAGNYVVIDGAGTDVDYVYMHLRSAPLVRTGQRVFTGQQIGEVGETGRATGCHLHFEMWSAPGWYDGGAAFDPLPHLQAWDAYS